MAELHAVNVTIEGIRVYIAADTGKWRFKEPSSPDALHGMTNKLYHHHLRTTDEGGIREFDSLDDMAGWVNAIKIEALRGPTAEELEAGQA